MVIRMPDLANSHSFPIVGIRMYSGNLCGIIKMPDLASSHSFPIAGVRMYSGN